MAYPYGTDNGLHMEDESSESLSFGLSRLNPDEETEPGANEEGESGPAPFSNEEIKEGDTLLGIYRVTSAAKSGAMGSVWRVHKSDWNISLAMKRPKPQYFQEGGKRRRKAFIDECDNWIRLGLHPNIVSCFYVREIGGVPSVFSEWMDKGSLKDRILDSTLYEGSEEEVQMRILDIAVQTARGLQYAHNNGLIHQDVKPANILLTEDWDAKAADFGLARAQMHLSDGERPLSGGFTPAFCPKEQAEGAPAAEWMDVYAWALTVLTMYAGKAVSDKGAEAFEKLFHEKPEQEWRTEPPAGLLEAFRHDYELKEAGPSGTWRSFEEMEKLLSHIYQDITGYEYPRESLCAAADTADSLNNSAMSCMDLGLYDKAEEYWQKALSRDPSHFEACINQGLFLWHRNRTTDLDMKMRLDYFKELYRYYKPDSRAKEKYNEVLQVFFEESARDTDAPVREGMRIMRDENSVSGQLTKEVIAYLHENDLRIGNAYSEGDRVLYEMIRYGHPDKVICTLSFNLSSGECLGIREGCAEKKDVPVPEGEYLFRMQTLREGRSGRGTVLQIIEPDSGRVIRSIEVDESSTWMDEDGLIRHAYPLLSADYENRRLVFISSAQFRWSLYDMPSVRKDRRRLSYTLMIPVPFRERSSQDRERRSLYDRFLKASQNDDLPVMLETYEKIWGLPLSGDNTLQAEMNSILMKRCRLPGVYHPGNGIEIRVSGHDPADPYPYAVFGILPVTDDLLNGSFSLPQNGIFRDGFDETVFYYPLSEDEASKLRIAYLDKKNKKLFERTVPVQTDGQHINRVTAVSSQGKYILLELRRNDPDDTYTIACFAPNGRKIGELFESTGECRLKAVFIEDEQAGPSRGYLYEPMTCRILYFEMDYNGFYCITDPERFLSSRYAIPMPGQLMQYDRYDERPHEVIVSVTLSEDCERMVIVTAGSEGDMEHKVTYLFDQNAGGWHRLPAGTSERIITGSHAEHVLIGNREGPGRSVWSWLLFPVQIHENHQKPVYELREFTPQTRIGTLSYDRCYLLDEKGMSLYAVCWKYRETEYE